jgi:hypothetical protein
MDEAAAWSAARACTEQKERDIADVQEDLTVLNHWGAISKDYPAQIVSWQRQVTRLQSALSALQQGMKGSV